MNGYYQPSESSDVCQWCGWNYLEHSKPEMSCPKPIGGLARAIETGAHADGTKPFQQKPPRNTLTPTDQVRLAFATACRQAYPNLNPDHIMKRAWDDAAAFIKKCEE